MEMDNSSNVTNATCTKQPDETKAWTLILILVCSVIANVFTIALVTRFKVRRVPDILVIGLAVSDLFAVCIPVVISVYEYFNPCVDTSGTLCTLFATLAQFTRYSSALIVSVVSVERYFAVNRPFAYRTYIGPFPYRFVIVLFVCWFVAGVLAIVPAVFPADLTGGVCIHEGYCLFCLESKYAIAVLIYAMIQYGVVCLCFTLVAINLVKVYRRRKRMTSRGSINQNSQAKERQHELTFTKSKLTSRISDLGKSLKTGISEKFQLGVEAEFGRMFFFVVLIFYSTWTTIVVLIIIAQIKGSQDELEESLFWGIRLTVIGTAINPIIYGIFARQYRTAYLYLLRLFFSKICRCVRPPAKNIFAASDTQSEVRRDTHRYNQRLVGAGSSEPVLVRSRAATFTTLSSIKDVDYLVPDFLESEHSMHTAKAGDLSSTAIIPYQLQDFEGSPHELAAPRRSLSLDGIAEESHYLQKISSTNKLAMILNNGGEGTHEEELIEVGKVYHNPAFEQDSHSNHNPAFEQDSHSNVTTPSPSEQGGLTLSDMGSTDYLVQRSPIMSHGNRGSTRERANTSPHPFEVPSLCTVVASFKVSEMKGGVKLTPNNTIESAASLTEKATSPPEGATLPPQGGVTLAPEGATSPPSGGVTLAPPGGATSPPSGGATSPPLGGATSAPGGATLAPQVISQTKGVTSQKENVTSSEGITSATECVSVSLPLEDMVSSHVSSVGEDNASPTEDGTLSPTSPRVQDTIVILQHANSTVSKTATGRRESATREYGSKTVQELKRQYEAAKKASSILDNNLPSPSNMVLPLVSKNRGNLWNNNREHHST